MADSRVSAPAGVAPAVRWEPPDVRFGSLADITPRARHVRFTPDSGHSSDGLACPFSANSGHRFASATVRPNQNVDEFDEASTI